MSRLTTERVRTGPQPLPKAQVELVHPIAIHLSRRDEVHLNVSITAREISTKRLAYLKVRSVVVTRDLRSRDALKGATHLDVHLGNACSEPAALTCVRNSVSMWQ